jgi:hypothetical protein
VFHVDALVSSYCFLGKTQHKAKVAMTYSNGTCSINSQNWKAVDILALSSLYCGYTDLLLRRLVRFFATKHRLIAVNRTQLFTSPFFNKIFLSFPETKPCCSHLRRRHWRVPVFLNSRSCSYQDVPTTIVEWLAVGCCCGLLFL